ncbi:AfsA-related hotdog domain-containing protein [Microbacterium sp. USTB-Y]|uniref:AfsA-related hotdog domain-containing protein n=1 Tax=Microbacterium sp. USTB-Y TaxID=2823692 RepID=UPI00203CE56F|nr:AfsA-related hotdog domain-containing protein [Microbacterium sp. USTB-Y]
MDIAPADTFTFTRTLDRVLVNRRSVAEVFLTDFHPVSDDEWIVGAQLPLGHAYFTDHLAAKFYDVLLILECCRQAGTYGGYTQFGSPRDTINMVSSLRLTINDHELLQIGRSPGKLVIYVRAVDVIRTGGRTRSATPQMTLFLDGNRLGSASIPVVLATPKLFQALRSRMRQGAPALTSELVIPDAERVDPARVGRERAANVLLADAHRGPDHVDALLSLKPDNCNILDHDYDHIPAMALVDAGLQLMTWDTDVPRNRVTGVSAAFRRFAEVDAPVALRGRSKSTSTYEVLFIQERRETGAVRIQVDTKDREGGNLDAHL